VNARGLNKSISLVVENVGGYGTEGERGNIRSALSNGECVIKIYFNVTCDLIRLSHTRSERQKCQNSGLSSSTFTIINKSVRVVCTCYTQLLSNIFKHIFISLQIQQFF